MAELLLGAGLTNQSGQLTLKPDQTFHDFMKVINVQDAKTHLSRLLEQVSKGEDIVLSKHGRPMARLTAYAPDSEPRKLGGLAGEIQIGANFDDEVSALFYEAEA